MEEPFSFLIIIYSYSILEFFHILIPDPLIWINEEILPTSPTTNNQQPPREAKSKWELKLS